MGVADVKAKYSGWVVNLLLVILAFLIVYIFGDLTNKIEDADKEIQNNKICITEIKTNLENMKDQLDRIEKKI